jgi:hypothetical protein
MNHCHVGTQSTYISMIIVDVLPSCFFRKMKETTKPESADGK